MKAVWKIAQFGLMTLDYVQIRLILIHWSNNDTPPPSLGPQVVGAYLIFSFPALRSSLRNLAKMEFGQSPTAEFELVCRAFRAFLDQEAPLR